jgi:hypothetical protein
MPLSKIFCKNKKCLTKYLKESFLVSEVFNKNVIFNVLWMIISVTHVLLNKYSGLLRRDLPDP